MSTENEKHVNGKTKETWPEIKKAHETKRYELKLVGAEISQRIEDNNNSLDDSLFKLKNLNFLEIAKTKLSSLPKEISLLENLTSLICYSNELTSVPGELGKLTHLKNLDLSNNKLGKLPEQLKDLRELMTLNLSGNQLVELFPLAKLSKLATLDISRNKFVKLPDDVCSPELENLSQIDVSFNVLTELPEDFAELGSLKTLIVVGNQLLKVPASLCKCLKLKELNLKENKLKDNRLKKLVEQADKIKPLIDYLERIYLEECKTKPAAKKQPAAKKKKSSESGVAEVVEYDLIKVMHFNNAQNPSLSGVEVVYQESVVAVRPHILCSIIRGLDLEAAGNFKKFLSIQTKIQEETCQKRTLATIATHDLEQVKGPLTYEARNSTDIELVPLGRKNPLAASDYYQTLMDEAEAERKAKKRNQLSGLYKYLSLLEGKAMFALVGDKNKHVISLPPLTNAEGTKMTPKTRDILIEVTSGESMDLCKKVMEELIVEMLQAGITQSQPIDKFKKVEPGSEKSRTSSVSSNGTHQDSVVEEEGGANKKLKNTLIMQQVKTVDSKGGLKCVYPSRVDLSFGNSNSIEVVRLYDD